MSFSNQYDIVLETPSYDTVGRVCNGPYFALSCALNQTGTFTSESKAICLI